VVDALAAGGGGKVALLAGALALLAFCAQTPRAASARHSSSCARRAVICASCVHGCGERWQTKQGDRK
jgi:hypothetical protein